ncbi:MAG TPA: hypothetical protein VK943_18890 [Arenibaculum sp.]|nr:hypothetical protein [Arenibaculum sp.]
MRLHKAVPGLLAVGFVVLGGPGVAPGVAPSVALPADEARIAQTFVTARTALQSGDGAGAVALLSEADIGRVERVRDAALAGPGPALDALPPAERLGALSLRHYMEPAEIRRHDAAGLVEHALARGWLDPGTIGRAGLGKVSVKGDRASGALLVDDQPALVPAGFVREGGEWRIDLGQPLQIADALIRTTALLSQRTEDQVVDEILEHLSARHPTR